MSYELEKSTGDIVISGFEQGIQPSPHKGIANIQNANISTEMGEVVSSFSRVQDTLTNTTATGTLGFVDSSHVSLNIANTNNLFKGNWITVTSSSNTGQLPNGTYYVPPSTGSNFQLSNYYNVGPQLVPVSVSALLVAGGGGGGNAASFLTGAGGGGGGYLVSTANVTSTTAYTITVGAGGAVATVGGNSSALGLTAGGGGAGGSDTVSGGNGGSGGGAGAYSGTITTPGTATGVGIGNNGGIAATPSGGGSGGGGGAGAVGAGATAGSNSGGNGGTGLSSSISGTATTYAGGGGGGGSSASAGTGGSGGGGTGGNGSITTGNNGTANTGGGAGGGGSNGGSGGAGGIGGSGIVIISATTGLINVAGTTGGIHTTSGGNDIWTFTASGTWTPVVNATTPAAFLTGFTAGLIASFTVVATMGNPLASATETYQSAGTAYQRYYILDNQNLVWVYDTQGETIYTASDNVTWFLPDTSTNWCTSATGIGVISGFLIGATSTGLFAKSVAFLGNTNSTATTWTQVPDTLGWAGTKSSTSIIHFVYVGHQGNMYITDGAYIANLEPISTISDSTGDSSAQNIQSFCNWTVNSQFIANYSIISGTTPNPSDFPKRVPVVFFTPTGGNLPTAITANTVYYMNANDSVFQVYTASSGGSALDIQTGIRGMQYFNTFYPISANTESTASTPLYYYQNQRLSLPVFEIAQCMAEIGNTIIIGCRSNILYPWDQIQNLPTSIISLPESNTANIITVHNMGYVFTGNKGNIYLTDGNVASAVTTIPDYCAGVPGTPSSYIEPVFQWGGAMYLRGRVYFSILDQTAIKAGNCGGIWSFTPTQSLYIGQDVGMALRLENQSSYGTYNGVATVLISKINQNAIAPQYFSGWESTVTNPTYGIDTTGTTFSPVAVIESDAIPTGTMLDKKTFSQIEFKLSSPLGTGDTVTLFYRKNLTDVWKTLGAVQLQSDRLSGYVAANFEKSQWLHLRTLLNASSSFIRLVEERIR